MKSKLDTHIEFKFFMICISGIMAGVGVLLGAVTSSPGLLILGGLNILFAYMHRSQYDAYVIARFLEQTKGEK